MSWSSLTRTQLLVLRVVMQKHDWLWPHLPVLLLVGIHSEDARPQQKQEGKRSGFVIGDFVQLCRVRTDRDLSHALCMAFRYLFRNMAIKQGF